MALEPASRLPKAPVAELASTSTRILSQASTGSPDAKTACRQFYDTVTEQLNASAFGPYSFFLNYGYVPKLNPQYSRVQLPERMLNKNSVLLVLEVLEDCVTAASRVLDVGCGRGGTLFVIPQFFQCPIASMSEDVRRMVGQNMQRLRIAAGLTQAQLAERMGVDRAYVSGLELDRLRRARWRNRQP